MTKEKTAWYPVAIKPHWKGIYEVRPRGISGFFYSKWNGNFWSPTSDSIEGANRAEWMSPSGLVRVSPSMLYKSSKWRGFTSEQ